MVAGVRFPPEFRGLAGLAAVLQQRCPIDSCQSPRGTVTTHCVLVSRRRLWVTHHLSRKMHVADRLAQLDSLAGLLCSVAPRLGSSALHTNRDVCGAMSCGRPCLLEPTAWETTPVLVGRSFSFPSSDLRPDSHTTCAWLAAPPASGCRAGAGDEFFECEDSASEPGRHANHHRIKGCGGLAVAALFRLLSCEQPCARVRMQVHGFGVQVGQVGGVACGPFVVVQLFRQQSRQ